MTPAAGRDDLRFRPPATDVPAAAVWALAAAFAGEPAADTRVDGEAAAAWAHRLGLRERIAATRGAELLRSRLGAEAAAGLLAASRRAAARNLLLRELAELAVDRAAARGIRVFLLKGIALLEEVGELDAARPLADVDLLAAPAAARELWLALQSEGLSASEVHESAQHLPALGHPELGILEIHVHLPGVQLAPGHAATAERLLARRGHRAAPELSPARIPERPLLAAHALAHAVVQNAHSPAGYPLLQLVADLQDLARDGRSIDDLIAGAEPFVRDDISARELDAVGGLCLALSAGEMPAVGSDPRRILDHVIAAHLDPSYRRALKVRALGAVVRRGDWRKVRGRARSALTPGRGATLPTGLKRLYRVGWAWILQRLGRGGAPNVL